MYFRKFFSSVLAAYLLLPPRANCVPRTVAPSLPTVTAPFATVTGQPSRLNPSVHEYLGIKYAYPPTGTRRFAPPERLPKTRNPVTATKFGYSCPALVLNLGPLPYSITGDVEDEGCLNLNIWTKPGRSGAPVMVWLYGGGYQWGTTDTVLYDGMHFTANNPVVMVSVNYRLNVFGFPNSPNVQRENLGILDQRMALEWVRDNIEAFGGDPKRITLFGESAGGASADLHAYAWPKDPIAQGLIAQSGTIDIIPLLADPSGDKFQLWGKLTQKVGCAKARNGAKVLTCMQQVPWRKLIAGVKALATCETGLFIGFGPRVDNRVIFSPEEYKRRAEQGLFAKLPLLVGSMDKEAMVGSPLSQPIEGCPTPPASGLSPEVLAAIFTAAVGTCPAKNAAFYRVLHNVPVWRYRYFGSFNSGLGASHMAELPALFGAALQRNDVSPRDAAFVRYLQSVWAAFAAAPAVGLASPPLNLPRYKPTEKTLIALDLPGEVKASLKYPGEYDYLCNFIAPESL